MAKVIEFKEKAQKTLEIEQEFREILDLFRNNHVKTFVLAYMLEDRTASYGWTGAGTDAVGLACRAAHVINRAIDGTERFAGEEGGL